MDSTNRNKRIAWYVAVGLHSLLLLVFFFLLAWTPLDPPIPEYGIEMNIGGIDKTSSSISSPKAESSSATASVEAENIEEVMQEANDANLKSEESQENIVNTETIDENSLDWVEEETDERLVEKQESTKEEKQPTEESKKVSESEPVLYTSESQIESDVKETEDKAPPSLEDRAIMKQGSGQSSTQNGKQKGSSLNLSGWDWDFKPKPNDNSIENGKIVFQIVVDDEGEILQIKTIEKTVSPVVEKIYRDAVKELTFSKTVNNLSVVATSTGKVTFIIRSK